jgi:hypothetical protein
VTAASRTHQPPEGTASSNSASRRTFLKGVGFAAAAGLAAPLLTSTSARASTGNIILGANADPWNYLPPTYPKGQDWRTQVPGALGIRSYRDTVAEVFSTNSGCPKAFPGEQNTIPVASIKPDPTALLNGDLDVSITALIVDGMGKATAAPGHPAYFLGTPQLTVWYEAGNQYLNGYGTVTPSELTPQIVRSMHVHMQNLCNQAANDPANAGLTRVEYGCIIFGDINKMANDSDTTQNYVPGTKIYPHYLSEYPMDWYGVDVYYEGYGSGNLDSTTLPQYMDAFRTMAQHRSGLTWPRINVCECNANFHDDSARAPFFDNLAQWLNDHGGRRMLTFFPNPAGNESVTWSHVVNAGTNDNTIDELNTIQSKYGA